MKFADMKELTIDELNQEVAKARKELFENRLKHSMQQLENTAILQQLKTRVARLKTVIRQKQAS